MASRGASLRMGGSLLVVVVSIAALGAVGAIALADTTTGGPSGPVTHPTTVASHHTTTTSRPVIGDTLVAACESDARTLTVAVAAASALQTGAPPRTSAAWHAVLLQRRAGGALLSSWPDAAPRSYALVVAGSGASKDSGDHLTPSNGDVVVRVRSHSYDFTKHPATACATA